MWPMIAAGVISAVGSAYGAAQTNSMNAGLTRSARRWQERMANTTHQRNVTDLQAAGLNPAIAYSGGAGGPATVPNTDTHRAENPMAGVSSAAAALGNMRATTEKTQAEIDTIEAMRPLQIQQMAADSDLKLATADQARSQIQLNQEYAPKVALEAASIDNQLQREKAITAAFLKNPAFASLPFEEQNARILQAYAQATQLRSLSARQRAEIGEAQARSDFYQSDKGRAALEYGSISNPWSAGAAFLRNNRSPDNAPGSIPRLLDFSKKNPNGGELYQRFKKFVTPDSSRRNRK